MNRRGGEARQPRRITERFSPDQLAQIAQEYVGGATSTVLCRKYALSKSAMLKILADAGVQMRHRPMTESQITIARQLYSDGLSLSEVAVRMRVPQATVQRTLWRAGVTLRAPNGGSVVERGA